MPYPDTTPRDRHVVIAIVTYRRPDDLGAALPIVLAEADTVDLKVEVVVVDNDPAESAAAVVARFPPVRYLREPVPGIAAARNRALDEIDPTALLIFIDDDEHPRDGWLAALLGTWSKTGAAAVAGPVVSEFDAQPPSWIVTGRYFVRRRLPTGTPITTAATNNLLLDLERIAPLGLRFDEAFGLSGGSDTLFTRQLSGRGAVLVWCDEAIVVDRVPVARMTRQWVLQRAFRSGNSNSRVAVTLCSTRAARARVRWVESMRGVARIVGGATRWAAGTLARSEVHRLRGRRSISRGGGMIAGANGRFFSEYARVPARQATESTSSSASGSTVASAQAVQAP